ncbi:MAG TPA: O-antigen ligase family protein, partial [Polyangia bacterium]
AATSAVIAVVAFAQRIVGATGILGFYQPRSQPGFGFFGTFVDVNHAAALLAIGALISAGVAIDSRSAKRVLFIVIGLVDGAALLYSTSRGGLAGFAVGGFVLIALLTARSGTIARAIVVASVALLVGTAVTLWAHEGLRQRFHATPTEIVDNQKTRGWAAGLRMAGDYPWTGVGRGAFAAPIDGYRKSENVSLVYPENVVVQMASEWGLPMTLVLIALVLATSLRLARNLPDASATVVAGACAIVSVAVHEMFDFSLELPGVAYPATIVVAAVAGRLTADPKQRTFDAIRLSVRQSWAFVAALALALLVSGAAANGRTLDDDWARLRALVASRAPDVDDRLKEAIARHPADDFLELLAAEHALREGRGDAMHHLNRTLELSPSNWQAHRMAARLLASVHHPAQAALEYRLAIENGMVMDVNELRAVVGVHVLDAVPQTPRDLVELARQLYGVAAVAEADAAVQRAVAAADPKLPVLMQRVQLALDANAAAPLPAASRALLAENDGPAAYALAAIGLARAGLFTEAYAAIDAGYAAHRSEPSLLLTGAEVHILAKDVPGARAQIAKAAHATLSLSEWQHAEELLVQIYQLSGDEPAAALAHARAELIAKQRRVINVPQ